MQAYSNGDLHLSKTPGRCTCKVKSDKCSATLWAALVAQLVKNLPAMRVTWARSLGWEGPVEKGKATHCSILAWRIPWTV